MKRAQDLIIPFEWAQRRPILLDQFFYIPAQYEYVEEKIPFFSENRPIMIEYCSGNGAWIVDRALQNPQYNWLAVEKKFERARQIWIRLQKEKMSHLTVVCGEGLIFTRYYAPLAKKVFVNFPDPWPKLRHAKHRLIRQEFLEALSQVVEMGGSVDCVTDDAKYHAQMMLEFSKCSDWKLSLNEKNLTSYGNSFFYDLWVKKGRSIYYLSHEKI